MRCETVNFLFPCSIKLYISDDAFCKNNKSFETPHPNILVVAKLHEHATIKSGTEVQNSNNKSNKIETANDI